jgi:hypothetical protein
MPTTLADILKGPRSKIQRANRHIDELASRSSPFDRGLYEIVNEHVPKTVLHQLPTRHRLTYKPKEDVAATFAGIIGDALGNIRAGLDHLAIGIVLTWGSMPAGPLYFPITKRKDLPAHSGLAALEQSIAGSRDRFLHELRPEAGPNERLWDFYILNKDDKHNDFIPIITVTEIRNIHAKTGNTILNNCSVGCDATKSHTMIDFPTPITISDDFETSVQIQFGPGTPFANDPVVPTLKQISHVASETIDWFGALIKKTKNIP